MTTEEIQKHIDAIIENTFATLQKVFDNKQYEKNNSFAGEPSGSRIIFPQYSKQYSRKGETRFSEQELRFIFVEEFNKYCSNSKGPNWFYSIETPTEEKYDFSKKENPQKVDKGQKGQSAMVDLSIHDEHLKRIALIEFKALNPDKSCFTKDFVKLQSEPGDNVLRYFVMYIKSYKRNAENFDYDTIDSLHYKIFTEYKDENTKYYCYVLDPKKEKRIEAKIKDYKRHTK